VSSAAAWQRSIRTARNSTEQKEDDPYPGEFHSDLLKSKRLGYKRDLFSRQKPHHTPELIAVDVDMDKTAWYIFA
jgi:hypothetical protein